MKAITDIMASKGTIQKSNGMIKPTEDKLSAYLLSILTAGTVACFAFLWNLNSEMAKITQQNIEMARIIDELRIRLNNVQLDTRDIRERLIRLETLNQKK